MEIRPEDIVEELRSISARLKTLSEESPERNELEERQDELRRWAQQAADGARNPASLRAELEHLQSRLAGFEADKMVVPAWQVSMTRGGRFSLTNPVADAGRINDAMDEATAPDRAAIEARIAHLESVLGE